MKDEVLKVIKDFKNASIAEIRNYTLKFAKSITKALVQEDYDSAKKLTDESRDIRDEVEFDEMIERNREFYFGYLYAYENIARRMIENTNINEDIESVIKTNDKLQKMVDFLASEGAVSQKQLCKYLGIESNQLANFLDTQPLKGVNIIQINKIGKNVIYSLTIKGKRFFKDKTSIDKKIYSNYELEEILEDTYGELSKNNVVIFEKQDNINC